MLEHLHTFTFQQCPATIPCILNSLGIQKNCRIHFTEIKEFNPYVVKKVSVQTEITTFYLLINGGYFVTIKIIRQIIMGKGADL